MIEIVYEKEKQKPEGNEGYFRIRWAILLFLRHFFQDKIPKKRTE